MSNWISDVECGTQADEYIRALNPILVAAVERGGGQAWLIIRNAFATGWVEGFSAALDRMRDKINEQRREDAAKENA